MKRLLFTSVLTLIAFSIILSCSSDEDDSPPPSNIVQTPEPTTPDPVQYTLTVTAGQGGTVSNQGGTYNSGSNISITAIPDSGYGFIGWEGIDLESDIINITLENNLVLEASFAELPVLVLPELPSKIFTKGVADTLSLSFTSSAGYKSIEVQSDFGIIEIFEEPEISSFEGEIILEYTPIDIQNIEFFRTIAGLDTIYLNFTDQNDISLTTSLTIRTQPLPNFRNYYKSSNNIRNDSYLRIETPLVRFLNQKDNKWNGQCEEIEDFGYNKYGNLHDGAGVQYAFADINNDGYDDILMSPGDSGMLIGGGFTTPEKYPDSLEIYLYNDGEFEFFKLNQPLAYYNNFFIIPADFDNDGDADFYLGNDGKDYEPFPGEVNVVLENKFNEGLEFEVHNVQYPRYNHQASVGDIDNDGDLDIISRDNGEVVGLNQGSTIQVIFENKGGFIFQEKLNVVEGTDNLNLASSNVELIDINNDGNLDLFVGSSIDPTGTCNGMDSEFLSNNGYDSCPEMTAKIFLGTGNLSFSFTNYILIPDVENFHNPGGKIFCYDLTGDGNKELIINRSGSRSDDRFATRGYYIQILSFINGNLIDMTNELISDNFEIGLDNFDCFLDAKVNGVDRLNDLDGNGNLDLYNVPQDDFRNFLRWEWNGVRFEKISP